jgi:HD-like signal output (HDOD) protein
MLVAQSASEADQQLNDSDASGLIKSIGIPSCPATLVQLQAEIDKDDPDFSRVARLVSSDVALTVAILRVVNSPAYGLSRHCDTVDQAINLLGLKQLNGIVTSLMLRNALRGDARQLTRFWDVSSKRSHAVARLARGLGMVDVNMAQSFGLFCDVGIPLLMQRFPDYGQTLQACNTEVTLSFTEVEQARHHTDHALVGAMMARSWGISPALCLAIRLHHDYAVFHDPKVPALVTRLIAMGLVAEVAIQRFARLNTSAEWSKGGDHAIGTLVLSEMDVEDWIDRLLQDFAKGLA